MPSMDLRQCGKQLSLLYRGSDQHRAVLDTKCKSISDKLSLINDLDDKVQSKALRKTFNGSKWDKNEQDKGQCAVMEKMWEVLEPG